MVEGVALAGRAAGILSGLQELCLTLDTCYPWNGDEFLPQLLFPFHADSLPLLLQGRLLLESNVFDAS